jgi:DEAD/DEAH box helicase domain-containing protein
MERYHHIDIAAAELLEVDSREISLSVHEIEDQTSWRIQLYDSEAGGSGHILELAERHHELPALLKLVLFRKAQHNGICTNACIQFGCNLVLVQTGDGWNGTR